MTVDLIADAELVMYIRKSNTTVKFATNAGVKCNQMQANLPSYGRVWFNQEALANILASANLVDKHHITYDSAKDDAFNVYTNDGIKKFKRTPESLYKYSVSEGFHDYMHRKKAQDKTKAESNLILTVKENKEGYSQREYE